MESKWFPGRLHLLLVSQDPPQCEQGPTGGHVRRFGGQGIPDCLWKWLGQWYGLGTKELKLGKRKINSLASFNLIYNKQCTKTFCVGIIGVSLPCSEILACIIIQCYQIAIQRHEHM